MAKILDGKVVRDKIVQEGEKLGFQRFYDFSFAKKLHIQ